MLHHRFEISNEPSLLCVDSARSIITDNTHRDATHKARNENKKTHTVQTFSEEPGCLPPTSSNTTCLPIPRRFVRAELVDVTH